jgi:hypothetical protein
MSTTDHVCKTRDLVSTGVRRSKVRRERGVALLLTIFGLLLLTAITAAMVYSSNSETLVSINYRDKQVASYAAISGLQEARNRIHPVSGDLAISAFLPTKTPDTGGTGSYVLYILNPDTTIGETAISVSPWNPASPYYDQELCQEGMLGLARGPAGVACATTALPGGGCTDVTGGAVAGWCAYYDNSANATPWQLTGLNYKWVRITLKEDWNTSVYVPKAGVASGQQVCWDGNYQNQIPAGYTAACMPTSGNSVIGVNLITPGAGYISAPTITISGGGGSGATATAQIGSSGTSAITNAAVSPQGSGYTKPPTVAFASPPDGTGASFKAFINGAAITNVSLSGSGTNYCYTSAPTANFSTSDPTDTLSSATATVNMSSAGCVAIVSPSGTCNNQKGNTVAIGSNAPPGGGSGFAANVVFDSSGSVSNIVVTSVGSGYVSGSQQITVGGNACKITPTFTVGKTIQSITLTNGGSYMNTPTAALSGSVAAPQTPVLPTVTANWPGVNSPVTGIQILSGGSGYLQATPYALTLCDGGNCSAQGSAITGAVNIITAINLTNGGQNYTSSPTVTITGGGGAGASATATIGAGSNNTAMGPVYMLTSLAVTKAGARSMAQMEAGVRPPFTFNIGGPLTLGGPLGLTGPDPIFPNSNNFIIDGNDANSCNQTATNKPAIGVYDSAAQQTVISSLGKPQNYIGAGGTPSIEDVYTQIGGASLTPSALSGNGGFIPTLEQYATSPVLTGNVTSLPATTVGSVTAVNGNLTLSGNPNGSGILIVTGTLTFSGNFTWNGLVLIVGQGQVVHNGGGNGLITGAMYISQTMDSTGALLGSLGSPQFTWNGGGGNTINYDHCLADGLLQKYNGQPSPQPLQVLSSRTLNF